MKAPGAWSAAAPPDGEAEPRLDRGKAARAATRRRRGRAGWMLGRPERAAIAWRNGPSGHLQRGGHGRACGEGTPQCLQGGTWR